MTELSEVHVHALCWTAGLGRDDPRWPRSMGGTKPGTRALQQLAGLGLVEHTVTGSCLPNVWVLRLRDEAWLTDAGRAAVEELAR